MNSKGLVIEKKNCSSAKLNLLERDKRSGKEKRCKVK